MGLLDFTSDLLFGEDAGTSTQESTATATPMPRPGEYDTLWQEFMNQYFGAGSLDRLDKQKRAKEIESRLKVIEGAPSAGSSTMRNRAAETDRLNKELVGINTWFQANPEGADTGYKGLLGTAYGEEREAQEGYLSSLTGLKEPYLGTLEGAMGTHRGLLDEIVNKRMSGDAVGPYGADIDKLLGERTGVSFGGGDPMQFITGSQQRLLSNLFGAQETGLTNIQGTSLDRAKAEIEPAKQRYGLGREIEDIKRAGFMPSNMADIGYLQSLLGMVEPMEHTRYHATPSVATTGESTASPIDQWAKIISMGKDVAAASGGAGAPA